MSGSAVTRCVGTDTEATPPPPPPELDERGGRMWNVTSQTPREDDPQALAAERDSHGIRLH